MFKNLEKNLKKQHPYISNFPECKHIIEEKKKNTFLTTFFYRLDRKIKYILSKLKKQKNKNKIIL